MYIFLSHKCLDYIRLIILSIQLGSLFVLMICFCLKCFLPSFSRGCHCFVWDVWLNNMTFAHTHTKTPQSVLHCVIVSSEWRIMMSLLLFSAEGVKRERAALHYVWYLRYHGNPYWITQTCRRRTLDRGGETGDLHTPSFPDRQTAAAKKERRKWWECDINWFFPLSLLCFWLPGLMFLPVKLPSQAKFFTPVKINGKRTLNVVSHLSIINVENYRLYFFH